MKADQGRGRGTSAASRCVNSGGAPSRVLYGQHAGRVLLPALDDLRLIKLRGDGFVLRDIEEVALTSRRDEDLLHG